MSYGSQSMTAPLKRVIVKRPEEAFRNQKSIDSQWKELGYTGPPDFGRAIEEHKEFVSILENSGVDVLFLTPDDQTGLDSIYTHDPAIVTDRGMILFQTGKEKRRGEGPAIGDAVKKWDVPILGVVDGEATAEGGDMIWLDRQTLLVGRGFRTNAAGISRLRDLLQPLEVDVMEVQLPYWTGPADCLHLMSFISIVDQDLAVVYSKQLPVPFFKFLQRWSFQLVEIPEEEYPTQASNVLALSPRNVVMLKGNPVTREKLIAAGCKVQEYSGQEISLKGSGGPTCLTRPLYRQE